LWERDLKGEGHSGILSELEGEAEEGGREELIISSSLIRKMLKY
jgi:hypothetical protein